MSDYSMPVLSEQERQELIEQTEECITNLSRWVKNFSEDRDAKRDLKVYQIALAALTAEPVAFGYEDGLFECGGKISSTATRHYVNPLYAAPPVPVIKQEGEQ